MRIVILKSFADEMAEKQLPLPEKLRRILLAKIKDAQTDEERRRFQHDLKIQ